MPPAYLNIFSIYTSELLVRHSHVACAILTQFLIREKQGVITYSTNLGTSGVVRRPSMSSDDHSQFRLLLETDALFMTLSNIYNSLRGIRRRLALSHSAVIPWSAESAANVAKTESLRGRRAGTQRGSCVTAEEMGGRCARLTGS